MLIKGNRLSSENYYKYQIRKKDKKKKKTEEKKHSRASLFIHLDLV